MVVVVETSETSATAAEVVVVVDAGAATTVVVTGVTRGAGMGGNNTVRMGSEVLSGVAPDPAG